MPGSAGSVEVFLHGQGHLYLNHSPTSPSKRHLATQVKRQPAEGGPQGTAVSLDQGEATTRIDTPRRCGNVTERRRGFT